MRSLRTIGKRVNVKVEMYAECKYTASKEVFENSRVVEYKDVVNWEVVTGEDATQIGLESVENSRDDFNEYLVLHFGDGSKCTFRNSYVDMFIIR